jgi:Tol biopolymer transport system component
MDSDGENQRLLYDSGYHDSDINWVSDIIAFTRNSQIWVMNSDGTEPRQVTDPPRAGKWGDAVLPFGDYDPRISPDMETIIFERMVDDSSGHGNYDLFSVNVDGSELIQLTETGWTQGLVSWAHDGSRIVFMVSAVGEEGRYDLYMMNADGSGVQDLTSEIFPPTFLAHSPVFSVSDDYIYFIGQWWDWHVLDSEISCMIVDASDDGYELDDIVSFKGSINPAVETALISLTVNGTENIEETTQVYTDESGEYSVSWKPTRSGSWTVIASWEGDAGHRDAESSPVSFTVNPEVTVPDTPEDLNRGIPGFPLFSVLSAMAVVLFLNRKRSFCH